MRHLIIFLCYLVAALALTFFGPGVLDMPANEAAVAGLLFFVLAGLAHEVFVRHINSRRMELGFEALATIVSEINSSIESNQEIINTIQHYISQDNPSRQEIEAMRTEVRVLQSLVSQLSESDGKRKKAIKKPAKIAKRPGSDQELLDMVRDGLRCDRVDLYLQPIVTLPQRKPRFFECYSRIRNKAGEIILPEYYVDIAESTGLIAAIDNMLLFRCIQLIRKTQNSEESRGFFCNLSRHTLVDSHFFGDFLDFLEDNRTLTRNLVFEVAQADIDNKDKQQDELLRRLVKLGCRLCLQQVTTINFDMRRLKSLGVDFIKIEASKLLEYVDEKNPAIDLLKMKKEMDRNKINLIIEKVEDDQVLVNLLDYGIDYGQGFLFGEPRLSEAT